MGTKELDVAYLHRAPAPDAPYHARNRIGMTAAVERCPRIVNVNTLERGGETVRVTLAAHLAIGDDVEPSALLVADRQDGGVILRLLEPFRRNAPQLPRPHARRKALAQLLAVDQPVGLRVAPHQRRGQQRQCGLHNRTSCADWSAVVVAWQLLRKRADQRFSHRAELNSDRLLYLGTPGTI